jgi:hypothetical protein
VRLIDTHPVDHCTSRSERPTSATKLSPGVFNRRHISSPL